MGKTGVVDQETTPDDTVRSRHRQDATADPNRIWAYLFLLALSLSLVGCVRPKGLSRVTEAGVLRVAIDPSFAPFEFIDAQSTLVGLDVDLGRDIARRLNVEAHFVVTGYDALYDALTVGRADIIISALYPDPSRTRDFVFSSPYFSAGDVLVVPQGSPIRGQADLAGATVACIYGSLGHMAALEWDKALTPGPTLLFREDARAAVEALSDGQADAALVDHVSALMATAHAPQLQILTPPLTDEPFVIAARSVDGDLMIEIENALQVMQEDGTLEEMIKRWMEP